MKLYNTLSKKVEQFIPLKTDGVTVYSCGPTLYDNAHIGNLSSFIAADTLIRTLRASGFNVTNVMNLTDVDDKTIRRSQEKYPELDPMEALTKLTRGYETAFKEDLEMIGNDTTMFIRATDTIHKMQRLIQQLFDGGFAYIAKDGVYFSIDAYIKSGKTYGQLTNIDSNNTAQERISNDEYDKESAHDFALWKIAKENEPSWDFVLDKKKLHGRPGWHIECSTMSTMMLGQPFDIHTGGVDLIFPHHENEIAQSTAGKDESYANFFMHSEHLLVDGKKMSKSLQNFYTYEDFKARAVDPLAFRLLVLQSHYRQQSDFTWGNVEAAARRLHNWRNNAALFIQYIEGSEEDGNKQLELIESAKTAVLGALQNDLGTPRMIVVVEGLFTAVADGIFDEAKEEYNSFLQLVDNLTGLQLQRSFYNTTGDQDDLLIQRFEARLNKDYVKADELREELRKLGLSVRDTPNGQIWSRI